MEEKVKIETIKMERSSRFPSIALGYAIRVITDARVFGRELNDIHLAGKGVPKGGAFGRKKASLGYYGLLERKGNSYKVTNLAESIIYPSSEGERLKSLKEAFLSPELFSQLYNITQKNVPIDIDILGNVVVRNYKISPSAKDEFLANFIRSGSLAELVEYADKDKRMIKLREQTEIKENIGEVVSDGPLEKNEQQLEKISPIYNFEPEDKRAQMVDVKLENGKGKLILPEKITLKDVEKLKALVEILAK